MLHASRKHVFFSILALTALFLYVSCAQKGPYAAESAEPSGNQPSRTESALIPDQSLPAAPGTEAGEKTDTKDALETEPQPPETETRETAPNETKEAPVETAPPETETSPNRTAKGYPITVKDGITYVNGILIANKTYTLPETYAPGKIIPECYQAFLEMAAAASNDGIRLYIRSDYRSYYDQRYIYAGYVQKDGAAAADRYSARAGHSEHQSGLALDLNSFEYSFGETPEGKWLAANAHLYGFIIRYPADKEALTGYRYEPWHVRYLGRDIAAEVYQSGLCLEEYLGITSSYDNCPLCIAEACDES